MKPVFISYAIKDKDIVLPFAERIEKQTKIKCWIDKSGIESGDFFIDNIVSAINNSSIVLFMLSENSIASKNTKKEILYAKSIGKRIIPVILDKGALRDWFLFEFGNIDYVLINNEEHIEKLFSNISAWTVSEEGTNQNPSSSFLSDIKNPLIKEALFNISQGKNHFEYIFRDYTFTIEISSLAKFILHYNRCSNNTNELQKIQKIIDQTDDETINASLAVFEIDTSSFEALISNLNPRFMLHIGEQYAVKVVGNDGYKDGPVNAAKELCNACEEFRIKKEIVSSIVNKMIEDPFFFDGKSDIKEDLDDDIKEYLPYLERYLDTGICRIHFKGNKKYNCDSLGIFYIGFSDIVANVTGLRVA